MKFHDFPDLFRYQFWHWFLMSFGIAFGSILGALWRHFPCFFAIDFRMNFRWHFLQILVLIRGETLSGRNSSLFRSCSAGGIFEGPLAHFGLPLPPFWLPLAPFSLPLAPFWLPFGALWLPFRSLLVPLACFGTPSAPLSYFGPYACESFSKNMFLGTRDRESTADSRCHPRRSNLSF